MSFGGIDILADFSRCSITWSVMESLLIRYNNDLNGFNTDKKIQPGNVEIVLYIIQKAGLTEKHGKCPSGLTEQSLQSGQMDSF